ncbi:MAG: hypothetical protein ABIS59_00085 [Candidatus Saccharibacteria bacterium]
MNHVSLAIRRNLLASSLIFVLVVIYSYLVFLYWQLNTLGVYDAAGQVEAITHAKAFWPGWNSWQPRELLGWPQGLLYPPGVHWLMTGLAMLVSVCVSVKLIVSLALLSLPVAIWWYLHQLELPSKWRLPVVATLSSILIVLPDYMGSSIASLFRLGLIPNFVVLPLIFLSFGATERLVRKSTKLNLAIAGTLFGLLVWFHLVAAIVGGIYLGVAVIVAAIRAQWRISGFVFASGVIGLVLSSPFLIRMIPLARTGIAPHGSIASLILPDMLAAVIGFGALVYLLRKYNGVTLTPALTAILLAGIGVLDGVLVRRYGMSFGLAWLNAYRLQIFAYILLIVTAAQVITHHAQNRRPSWLKYVTLSSIALIILTIAAKNPSRFAYAQIDLKPNVILSGRFLESFRRSESYPAPYTMQTKLLSANPSSSWAYGLFIESSANSAFVKSLSRSLRPEAYLGDPKGTEPEDTTIAASRVGVIAELFGISNILSLDTNETNSIGTWSVGLKTKYYHLTKDENVALAEVPKLPLRAVSSNWHSAVLNWWKEAGPVVDLPYDATDGQISSVEAPEASVSMNIVSDTHLELKVVSERPTPVLIKMTYAPGWKATAADGSPLKIWRVAPHLMMVEAKGAISLNYR